MLHLSNVKTMAARLRAARLSTVGLLTALWLAPTASVVWAEGHRPEGAPLKPEAAERRERSQLQQLTDELRHEASQGDRASHFDNFARLQRQLGQLETPTALLYHLVFDDRLELILAGPEDGWIRRSVPVARRELAQTIAQFRSELQDPSSNPHSTAQQLYQWLIEPIAADLSNQEIEAILFVPDGPLRYVPLAALHDGERWLVEDYGVNQVASASLTDLGASRSAELRVLAAGVTEALNGFSPLPGVAAELAAIAQVVPKTRRLLDEAFTERAIASSVEDYNILHLASHAALVPGRVEDSYILLGDGDRLTAREG